MLSSARNILIQITSMQFRAFQAEDGEQRGAILCRIDSHGKGQS